jgi:hypothetical protein
MAPIFNGPALHAAIDHSLLAADLGTNKNAFVLVATVDGVKGVLSTKVNEHWTVSAMFDVDRQAHVSGGLEIKASW